MISYRIFKIAVASVLLASALLCAYEVVRHDIFYRRSHDIITRYLSLVKMCEVEDKEEAAVDISLDDGFCEVLDKKWSHILKESNCSVTVRMSRGFHMNVVIKGSGKLYERTLLALKPTYGKWIEASEN